MIRISDVVYQSLQEYKDGNISLADKMMDYAIKLAEKENSEQTKPDPKESSNKFV